MPYHLSRDKLSVLDESGKPVPGGKHKTAKEAQAHLAALEANVPDAKSASMKVGARHNSSDQAHVQAIHDSACKLGASCDAGNEDMEAQGKSLAIKDMLAMGGVEYAIHEGWDIQQCCSAISQITSMCQDECAEGEMDEALALCKIVMALMKHCQGECQEMMDAIKEPAPAEYGSEPAMLSTSLPLFSYVKHLNIPHDEQFIRDVLAAKSVDGKDTIRYYNTLWGSPTLTDIENEFFTGPNQKGVDLPPSDFWDEYLPVPKVLTWDHAQDSSFKADPRIGVTLEWGDDEIGRWAVSQLKRNHLYRNAIDKLISKRDVGGAIVGPSSDSAPQYVERVPQKNKSIWLKSWPWMATALTATPCEPRMLDIGAPSWKSLGLVLPAYVGRMANAGEPDGSKGIPAELYQEAQLIKYKVGVL